MGLDGPITIRRARFQCETTGRMVVPLDEALDLPAGETTPSLAKRTLRLGTRMSFAELEDELQAQHDVRLTDSTLDTLAQKVGTVAVADLQAKLDVLAALPRGVSREQKVAQQRPAPKRLYISCDGITYRTCYREDDPEHPGQKRVIYQEMKCGAVYWQDEKERWHKQVVSGRDNPERFGLCLWKLAVECGLLSCPEVIFISDGGGWCNTVAELYFKDVTRILDWYHLSEYVWKAGRGLYPGNENQTSRWVHGCLDHLHDSGGSGMLAHLQRCKTARGEQEAEGLDVLINYLTPRLAITDYPKYRANGYLIGSGMMESSCKQIVEQRLKGTGMQWSEQGALAMAALVSQRLNGTWDPFWAARPLQRVA
jgi:hypothetical protein